MDKKRDQEKEGAECGNLTIKIMAVVVIISSGSQHDFPKASGSKTLSSGHLFMTHDHQTWLETSQQN